MPCNAADFGVASERAQHLVAVEAVTQRSENARLLSERQGWQVAVGAREVSLW